MMPGMVWDGGMAKGTGCEMDGSNFRDVESRACLSFSDVPIMHTRVQSDKRMSARAKLN